MMSEYSFIYVRNGEPETVRVDLPDNRSAWQEAVSSLGDLLNDVDGRLGHNETIELVIQDKDGQALWELECRSKCRRSI